MADQRNRRPRDWEIPNPLVAELIALPIFSVLTADPNNPQAFNAAIRSWATDYSDVDRSYLDMRLKMVQLILTDELRTRLDRHTALLKSIGTGTRLTVERLDAMIDGEEQWEGDPLNTTVHMEGIPEVQEDDAEDANGSSGPLNGADAQVAFAALDASGNGVAVPGQSAPKKKRASRKRRAPAKKADQVLDAAGNVVG